MRCVRCGSELDGRARVVFILYRNASAYTEPWDSCLLCSLNVAEAMQKLADNSRRLNVPNANAKWRIDKKTQGIS